MNNIPTQPHWQQANNGPPLPSKKYAATEGDSEAGVGGAEGFQEYRAIPQDTRTTMSKTNLSLGFLSDNLAEPNAHAYVARGLRRIEEDASDIDNVSTNVNANVRPTISDISAFAGFTETPRITNVAVHAGMMNLTRDKSDTTGNAFLNEDGDDLPEGPDYSETFGG